MRSQTTLDKDGSSRAGKGKRRVGVMGRVTAVLDAAPVLLWQAQNLLTTSKLLPLAAAQPRQYQHQPIDPTQRTFRLVKLSWGFRRIKTAGERSRRIATIFCNVREFDLDKAPEYTALSYEWGKSSTPETAGQTEPWEICVGDCTLSVTKNLRDFLKRLVGKGTSSIIRSQWLYIDQLCIDQHNVEERNHQVGYMADIYKGAKEVFVWLGDGSEDRSMQMRLEPSFTAGKPEEMADSEQGQYSLGLGLRQMPESQLSTLIQSSFWTRLWIIQECVLARRITLLYQHYQASWESVQVFVEQLQHPSERSKRVIRLSTLRNQKNAEKRARPRTWTDVMALAQNARCQDIRDRAFGMLGLVHEDLAIIPDYRLSAAEIVEKLVQKEFKHRFGIQLTAEIAREAPLADLEFIRFIWAWFLAFGVWTSRWKDPRLKYIRGMLPLPEREFDDQNAASGNFDSPNRMIVDHRWESTVPGPGILKWTEDCTIDFGNSTYGHVRRSRVTSIPTQETAVCEESWLIQAP